jgi:hypothetical protein
VWNQAFAPGKENQACEKDRERQRLQSMHISALFWVASERFPREHQYIEMQSARATREY